MKITIRRGSSLGVTSVELKDAQPAYGSSQSSEMDTPNAVFLDMGHGVSHVRLLRDSMHEYAILEKGDELLLVYRVAQGGSES